MENQNLNEAEKLYEAADNKFDMKAYEEAIELISKAISLYPEYVRAYNLRGLSKKRLKDFSGAMDDYDTSIKLDKTNFTGYLYRAYLKDDLKDYHGALADYDTALLIKPDSTKAYYFRGRLKFYNLSDDLGAIEDYTKAIILDQTDDSFYYERGFANHYLEKYQEAVSDFDKAIDLNSSDGSYLNGRGLSKHELADYRGAIDDYTIAIRLQEDEWKYYFNRGLTRIETEDYKEAIADFTVVVENEFPENPDSYSIRASLRIKLEDFEGAIQDYDYARYLNPDDAEIYYRIGLAKSLNNSDYFEIFYEFTEAIERDPDNPLFYYRRAFTALKANRYEESLKDFNKALDLKPDESEWFILRASVKYYLHDYQGAYEDWEISAKMGNSKASKYIEAYRQEQGILSQKAMDTSSQHNLNFPNLEQPEKTLKDKSKSLPDLLKWFRSNRSLLIIFMSGMVLLYFGSKYLTQKRPAGIEQKSEPSSSGRYIVNSTRAYFYDSPDPGTIRKGYVLQGDEIDVVETVDGFGYSSYTSSSGKVTSGWLKLEDMQKLSNLKPWHTAVSKVSEDVSTGDGANVTELKIGNFSWPIIGFSDPAKANQMNDYLIGSILGDEYNRGNLKLLLEKRNKEVAVSYRGLTSLSYEIIFNNAQILSINITSCSTGNRENCETTQYNFDMKTGLNFGIDQIIKPSKIFDIKEMIIFEIPERLEESKKKMQRNGAWIPEYEIALRDECQKAESDFFPDQLLISKEGITFICGVYPYSLADMAYYPLDEYFYSWKTLKPFLLESGPVSTLLNAL